MSLFPSGRANEALLARDAEVNHYMKAAARLQNRVILPQAAPDLPEIAWGVHYSSLDPLGGDLYAFARPDEDHLGVLIADASGHGVPAAMVAILARQAFLEAARTTTQPGEVLSAMNERLQGMTDERFVTAFYGVLDRRTRLFSYANAGHPFPVWYSAHSRQAAELSARGFMLGIMSDEVFKQAEVKLEPGDRLCLFTDGVGDCRDERGATFGVERLRELLPGFARGTAASITEAYVAELNAFRGAAKPVDDMTLMVGEIR
jgi:sigma-B regulation protein RsbU (phosphoserine phosphatase)